MKKFLLGFAFIASLAFMLTSCPGGAKEKDSVKGSDIELYAGNNYSENTGKEITINLASDTFKEAMAKNATATAVGITIKVKNGEVTEEGNNKGQATYLNLSNYFKVKDATEAKAKKVVLYYVEPFTPGVDEAVPTAALVEKDTLVVEIASAKLTNGGDNPLTVPTNVKFSVCANVGFNKTNIAVVSFVEKAAVTAADGKMLALTLNGANLKEDQAGEGKIDITTWFKGLPTGIKAERNRLPNQTQGETTSSFYVYFSAEANATTATSTAAKVSVEIPVEALTESSTSSLKSNENVVFFVTKDPNAADAANKPKLTVSNGTVSGKIGEPITAQEFTLTLVGDCVLSSMSGDNRAELNASRLLNNFVKIYVTEGTGDDAREVEINDWKEFIAAEISEDIELGATSFKMKFSPKMIEKDSKTVAATAYSAFDARLEALLPGFDMGDDAMPFICNVYGSGSANALVSEKNDSAKVVITDARTMTLTDIVLTQAHREANAAFDMVVTLTGDKLAADLAAETNVKSWFGGDAASVIDTATVKAKANKDDTTFTVSIVPTQGKDTSLGEKVSPFAGTFTIPRANLASSADLVKTISVAITFAAN